MTSRFVSLIGTHEFLGNCICPGEKIAKMRLLYGIYDIALGSYFIMGDIHLVFLLCGCFRCSSCICFIFSIDIWFFIALNCLWRSLILLLWVFSIHTNRFIKYFFNDFLLLLSWLDQYWTFIQWIYMHIYLLVFFFTHHLCQKT